jgi:hypothetical protein
MIWSILVSRGALLIPDSIRAEILELPKVVCVEQAKLNVVEKQVILYNLTVALEGQEDATFVLVESLRTGIPIPSRASTWKWTMFMYSSTLQILYWRVTIGTSWDRFWFLVRFNLSPTDSGLEASPPISCVQKSNGDSSQCRFVMSYSIGEIAY